MSSCYWKWQVLLCSVCWYQSLWWFWIMTNVESFAAVTPFNLSAINKNTKIIPVKLLLKSIWKVCKKNHLISAQLQMIKILRNIQKLNTKKASQETFFLVVTHFIIAYHICIVKVLTKYYNNNLLLLDVKQLNRTMKLYYFYTLKALWNSQGKIKIHYGIPRVKKQLSRKRSFEWCSN